MTNSDFTSLKIFFNERNLCEYLFGVPGTTSILALKMKRWMKYIFQLCPVERNNFETIISVIEWKEQSRCRTGFWHSVVKGMIHSFWKDKCQVGFFIVDGGETNPKSPWWCRYLITEIIHVHFGSMKTYRQKREKYLCHPTTQITINHC